jgi:hypothetical protein
MKEIIYTVCEAGSDGRGPVRCAYAAHTEAERDAFYAASPGRDYQFTRDLVVDMEQEAHEAWAMLSPIQKLALLSTSCPMWQMDYVLKDVGEPKC